MRSGNQNMRPILKNLEKARFTATHGHKVRSGQTNSSVFRHPGCVMSAQTICREAACQRLAVKVYLPDFSVYTALPFSYFTKAMPFAPRTSFAPSFTDSADAVGR